MKKKLDLREIKDTRVRIESLCKRFYEFNRLSDRDKKIIVDALVFLNYKLSVNSFSIKNLFVNKANSHHSVISALHNEDDVKIFFRNILTLDTVNIQGVIDCYAHTFDIDSSIELNIEKILEKTDVSEHPLANLAIQLFLLRGNYNWEMFPQTDFLKIVSNNLDNIPSNAVLNCWEGVLVALYKAKIIDKHHLQKIYNYPNLTKIPLKVAKLFKPDDMLFLDEKLKPQLGNKACIICFDKLAHVMINIPFSQKQILRMLITGDFNETPDKVKLYSLWTLWTDGKFDTVKKSDFKNDLAFKYYHQTNPVTLTHLNLKH